MKIPEGEFLCPYCALAIMRRFEKFTSSTLSHPPFLVIARRYECRNKNGCGKKMTTLESICMDEYLAPDGVKGQRYRLGGPSKKVELTEKRRATQRKSVLIHRSKELKPKAAEHWRERTDGGWDLAGLREKPRRRRRKR